MALGLFLSAQFIKENTAIDGNVDEKYLNITIADAQRMHILPLLGTALYNEINDGIVAGTTTANNASLLTNYIQDALKYWVLVESLDIATYKITNKAVVKKNSDNSQPIQESETIRLMDRNKEKAEFFSQRLTNYLWANASTTLYPLFLNPGSAYDTVFPRRNDYTVGWALDQTRSSYGLDIDRGRNNYC